MRSALRRATAARRRRHKSGMPADYAMVPPFPRGGWNAHQPPFPEVAPTTQLTTLPSGLRVVSQETHTYMSAVGVVITGGFHSSVPGSAAVLAIAVEGLSITGNHGLGSDTRNATLLQVGTDSANFMATHVTVAANLSTQT